jgi:hypothetical protein
MNNSSPPLVLADRPVTPLFDPERVLGRKFWLEAYAAFDFFADAEQTAGLSLEQQDRVTDARIDRVLHQTLAELFELTAAWIEANPMHALAGAAAQFVTGRSMLGTPRQIELYPQIMQWGEEHRWSVDDKTADAAGSILEWHRLAIQLAEMILVWAAQHPADPRSAPIALWHDSPGSYPECRLKFWALAFPADPRSAQVLAWEEASVAALRTAQPELLAQLTQE